MIRVPNSQCLTFSQVQPTVLMHSLYIFNLKSYIKCMRSPLNPCSFWRKNLLPHIYSFFWYSSYETSSVENEPGTELFFFNRVCIYHAILDHFLILCVHSKEVFWWGTCLMTVISCFLTFFSVDILKFQGHSYYFRSYLNT